jgi:acetolactate synthase-1/2/3 large subunit
VLLHNPDFVKIAEAHGIPARTIEKPDEIRAAIDFARSTRGPVLIDCHVEKEEGVYPMVPPGADLHAMIRRPVQNAKAKGG